ncbi:hypothetical protein V6N11_079270 [Hibiscus sabdariffa]|uniref:F-box associated domain-containing protein n=1 Tax=Hibiscus sabdariffa TaxID=183260 RepID=A0ABR2RVF3_9ROSI
MKIVGKRVTAIPPNYAFGPQSSLPFGLIGFSPVDLSIMKYGESSFTVSVDPITVDFHELWVMEKYGVVQSWTKVLTLHRVPRFEWVPRVMGFRKNGEVLLRVRYVKMASLDLNSQQMGASLYLNCELMEFHGVEVGSCLLSLSSYVESLVLLDKADEVHNDSDVYKRYVYKRQVHSLVTKAWLSDLLLEVYCHNNSDIFPKKTIPAVVVVNLAEEMGKLGPNSNPSFAAILQLALQREYRDSTEKIAIRSHGVLVNVGFQKLGFRG